MTIYNYVHTKTSVKTYDMPTYVGMKVDQSPAIFWVAKLAAEKSEIWKIIPGQYFVYFASVHINI